VSAGVGVFDLIRCDFALVRDLLHDMGSGRGRGQYLAML
jgi:hypothetical protein